MKYLVFVIVMVLCTSSYPITQEEYPVYFNSLLEYMECGKYIEALDICYDILDSDIEIPTKDFHIIQGILDEIREYVSCNKGLKGKWVKVYTKIPNTNN